MRAVRHAGPVAGVVGDGEIGLVVMLLSDRARSVLSGAEELRLSRRLDEMAAPHQGPYAARFKRCPMARDVQPGNPIARRGLIANYMIEEW